MSAEEFSKVLSAELLELVNRPGQYLGNEWGARRKPFENCSVRLALAFPDLYELGMSNFGLKILYQIVNEQQEFLADRVYAPAQDMEQLLRERRLSLWGWESRQPLQRFELVGFSLQYELTYTNVLNMLELSHIPVFAHERTSLFPLIFGGGPSAVNPEPMAQFMDFFIIGDGEEALPAVMEVVRTFKKEYPQADPSLRMKLLARLALTVPGVYVPAFYTAPAGSPIPKARHEVVAPLGGNLEQRLPERILRQTVPLSDANQPTNAIVPYLSLVHDRDVLEVRRGCDRGCRFCQPGYTFLPVRERSSEDLLRLSKNALAHSGHQEYSMLSLCVSDYTSLHESVRALNQEHSSRRASLSFPSQRADRMNLDLAEELKTVRKSGITLAPEAGTERLRAVINKGLSHAQIINAIEAAYQSGWTSIKLYFMCCLPTEQDEDLQGIIEILKEAIAHCRAIRRTDPLKYRKDIEFTCTISNFVPKPFTPFQWFGQVDPVETARKHSVLKQALNESRLRKNVQLNLTDPQISLLESVISRGDRRVGDIIHDAWRAGCTFDAWDEKFQPSVWHETARKHGATLEELACTAREVGSEQPWEVIHIGLHNWWLIKEWEKAMAVLQTPPCTENLCHACGVCTELDQTHLLAAPRAEVIKRNPFVKELSANTDPDHHPSLFFVAKQATTGENTTAQTMRFSVSKSGDLRFISHLDLQQLLARAIRRANMALAYTNGFNPQPKLMMAAALPLFQESDGEVGELELAEEISADEFARRVNLQLPPEVQFVKIKLVERGPSLSSRLGSASYRARLLNLDAVNKQNEGELAGRLATAIEKIMSAPTVLVDGTAKSSTAPVDIRPGILSLSLGCEPLPTLYFELTHSSSKMHVKPAQLLAALAGSGSGLLDSPVPMSWRVTRLQLKTENGALLFDV